MKTATKRNTITVRTDTVISEGVACRYTLLRDEDLHSTCRTPLYYIRAAYTDIGEAEAAETDAIIDPGYALMLYEILRENFVLPEHLRDIAEEFYR